MYIHSKTKVCPKVVKTHSIALFGTINICHCNCLFFIDLSMQSYCTKCKDLEFGIVDLDFNNKFDVIIFKI